MLKQQLRKRAMSQRGMTLIEIMVVIAIIGIVMTAIGVGVVSYLSDAKVGATKAQLRKIAMGVTQYQNMEGDLPNDLQAVVDRRYIKPGDLKDPWKNDIIYQSGSDNPDGYRLCSRGPDEAESSKDDICHDDSDKE